MRFIKSMPRRLYYYYVRAFRNYITGRELSGTRGGVRTSER
ncbi:MAG: hypothetical protein ACE10E_10170 [Acidiferrobacterales bacterium]